MTLISLLLLATLQAPATPAQPPAQEPISIQAVLPNIPIESLNDFDSHVCTPAQVTWIDAMIRIKATSENVNLTAQDIENDIPGVISYGCVNKTENAVVILHSFVRGEPDDYLVVPKGWIKRIVPLRLKDK